jgi:tRNA threonylcarbamoyladenosine biosynthesis protein TsaB
MNVLSLDTTADICSIALFVGDQRFSFHEHRPREHAKILLPEIERLVNLSSIALKDIDLIVFGRGPGSFTGVRISTAVAQGLAASIGCNVFPVSTLHSLAYSAQKLSASDIFVAIDARMSEVYFARYHVNTGDKFPTAVLDECVIPPIHISELPTENSLFIGNGWEAGYEMANTFSSVRHKQNLPSLPNATDSAELALAMIESGHNSIDPATAIPTYLRDNVTWEKKPKIGS